MSDMLDIAAAAPEPYLRARASLRSVPRDKVELSRDRAALLPAAALGRQGDGVAPPLGLSSEDVHP